MLTHGRRGAEPGALGDLLDGQVTRLEQVPGTLDALVGQPLLRGAADLLATVPPTIALCRDIYGDDGAVVFGWVNGAHQVGAALAGRYDSRRAGARHGSGASAVRRC